MRPDITALKNVALRKYSLSDIEEVDEAESLKHISFNFMDVLFHLRRLMKVEDLSEVREVVYSSFKSTLFDAALEVNRNFLMKLSSQADLLVFSYRTSTSAAGINIEQFIPAVPFFRWNSLISLSISLGLCNETYLRSLWKAAALLPSLKILCLQLARRRENPRSLIFTPDICQSVLEKVVNLEYGFHTDADHACMALQRGIYKMEKYESNWLFTTNITITKLVLAHLMCHQGDFNKDRIAAAAGENNPRGFVHHLLEEDLNN